MFKNLDNREKAYGTLILFAVVAYIFYMVSDGFSLWAKTANPWIATMASIILNPAYIVLIIWLWNEYELRGLLAGLLISISVDIMSLGHSIGLNGMLPSDAAFYTYSDTTFFKIITPFFHGKTAVLILYVALPILLVYLALRIIRKNASFNKIFKEAL